MCRTVWKAVGYQTASSVLLYDALPHSLPWASLSLGFDTSVALVGPWAPRTYLSLCQSCSWACMWVQWAQLMCSRSHSKHSHPLCHLRTPSPLWDNCDVLRAAEDHTNTCSKCPHSRMNIPGLMFNTNSRKVNPCMSDLEADTWKWPFLFLKLTVKCIAYFLHSLENQIGINSSLRN